MIDPRSSIKGLYAIVDNAFSPRWSHLELAQMFLVAGCKVLQLRMKKDSFGSRLRSNNKIYSSSDSAYSSSDSAYSSSDSAYSSSDSAYSSSGTEWSREVNLWNQEVYEVAKSIMELKKRYDFTFIVNDYVDVAAELNIDGIHVGANDMRIDEIKRRVDDRLFVGYSSHSVDEALDAKKCGADYIALGAIYPTKTKGPGHPVQGVEKLKELVSKVSVPVVAIGGINRTNVEEVWSTGVSSVAMITGLTQAPDVVKETKWYVNKIQDPRSKIQSAEVQNIGS